MNKLLHSIIPWPNQYENSQTEDFDIETIDQGTDMTSTHIGLISFACYNSVGTSYHGTYWPVTELFTLTLITRHYVVKGESDTRPQFPITSGSSIHNTTKVSHYGSAAECLAMCHAFISALRASAELTGSGSTGRALTNCFVHHPKAVVVGRATLALI